jgi:hypothetical protein
MLIGKVIFHRLQAVSAAMPVVTIEEMLDMGRGGGGVCGHHTDRVPVSCSYIRPVH